MAPNFQSSFIPKGPVTQEVFKKKKTSLFGILVIFLFIASIIISIGLFVYKGIVKNDIKNLQSQLTVAETKIDRKEINEMSQFSKKLGFTKLIISKHQVVSNFMDTLASSTVSSVYFDDFNYDNLKKGNNLTVVLHGKATDYASVALQENVFSQNKYFKSVTFSNLTLTDKGLVSFDLTISVDPRISVYSP